MNTLIMAAQLILGISILVILHELGHYAAARAFGIKVEKFYLFFDAWGYRLFRIKRGDTEYGIGWLPFGGYVKIAGMIDESMDMEQMKKEPQPWEFRSKPAWQRLIVMIGGVTVNLILGILIFGFILLKYEKNYLPMTEVNTHGIYVNENGQLAGLQPGDKILSINGKQVHRFKDAQSIRHLFGSTIEIERNGQHTSVTIPDNFYRQEAKPQRMRFIEPLNFPFTIDSVFEDMPAARAGLAKGDRILQIDSTAIHTYGQFKEIIGAAAGKTLTITALRQNDTLRTSLAVDSNGLIGILAPIPYNNQDYRFFEAMRFGFHDAMDMLVVNIKGLGKVFSGKEKATESIQGPIGIARIYGAEWIWSKFWFITGLLSLILAFMNILPIPALDGGHVIFLLFEMITRRKPSDKFLEYAQMTGLVILLAIMAFAVGNDIFKLFK